MTTFASLAIGPIIGLTSTYGYKTINTWILIAEAATIFHVGTCLIYEKRQKSKTLRNIDTQSSIVQ